MPDFRRELYSKYRSTNKVFQFSMNEVGVKRYSAYCRHKHLPLLSGLDIRERILEIGCGAGFLLDFLRKQGFSEVEGIDISQEQITVASSCGLDVKVADAIEFLNSKLNLYGAIIAIDLIEHFSREEQIILLRCIFGALKQGGRFIFQTPNGAGLSPGRVIYGDVTHCSIFTPDSLWQLLRFVGFDEINFYETGPIPRNIKGVIRVVLWQCIKLVANMIRMIETGGKQKVWTENIICSCCKSK